MWTNHTLNYEGMNFISTSDQPKKGLEIQLKMLILSIQVWKKYKWIYKYIYDIY